jgi:hypothetical protein
MTDRSRQTMLLDHAHFPVTILQVLSEKVTDRGPRSIPASDPGRLPDPSTGSNEAKVELVVLIPNQFFVEKTNPIEQFTAPTTKVDCIHLALVVRVMPPRATNSEGRLKRRCYCLTDVSNSSSDPRPAHVVRPGFFKNAKALHDVVGGVFAMRIHPHNNLPGSGLDCSVKASGDDLTRIIDYP